MKPHEGIQAAAKRELAEESGYGTRSIKILGSYYTNNRLWDQKQYVVLCTQLYQHKLTEDHDEFIETFWMTKKGLEHRIEKNEFDNINLLAALNLWFYSK